MNTKCAAEKLEFYIETQWFIEAQEKTKISECETEKVVVEFGSEKIEIGMSKFRMGKLMSMNETECGKEIDNIDENIKIKICL